MTTTTAIPYECGRCQTIFSADVDEATRWPVGDRYGPCPACGAVCEPGGWEYDDPTAGVQPPSAHEES